MDITALVGAVVPIVGGWLARTGGRIASRVGDKVADKIGAAAEARVDERVDELYAAVRDRLVKTQRGERAVTAFEREPASDGTRVGVETLLEQEAGADPDFAARLAALLAEAEEAGASETFVQPTQTIHGDVRQTGHDRSTQVAQSSGTINIDHRR